MLVISRGPSEFYQQSLYKHGWSLFKQSMTLESLPSFGKVLDQGYRTADIYRSDKEKKVPGSKMGALVEEALSEVVKKTYQTV